jgi:hypothetical protein
VFRCPVKGELEESEIREMEVDEGVAASRNAERVDIEMAAVVAEPVTGVEVVGVRAEAEALECRWYCCVRYPFVSRGMDIVKDSCPRRPWRGLGCDLGCWS